MPTFPMWTRCGDINSLNNINYDYFEKCNSGTNRISTLVQRVRMKRRQNRQAKKI